MSASTVKSELAALVRLGAPILASQISQAAYGALDTIMAGRASANDLAAVAMGSGLCLPVMLLIWGILMATTPLVAEAWGARHHHRIPDIVHQSLWLALALGGAAFWLIRHMQPVFGWVGVPDDLRALTRQYLEGFSWGMPAMAAFAVLRCYCEGLGLPASTMLISVLGLPLNALGNYLLIYGHAGLPRLGGPGCGWATSFTQWVLLAIVTGLVLNARRFAPARLFHAFVPPRAEAISRYLRLGLPMGFALFFEVSVFCVVSLLISPLGATVVAGHQIAFSVTGLIFMCPLSLALAMTIRVGHAYGRRDIAAIRQTRRVGLRLTSLFAMFSSAMILCFRWPLTAFYAHEPAVQALAANLLLFAAAYQVFDALQAGAAGLLRGIQDAQGPLVMTGIAYWLIAIPVGYTFGLSNWLVPRMGPQGLWLGLVAGLLAAALLLNWRLSRQLGQLRMRWADGFSVR